MKKIVTKNFTIDLTRYTNCCNEILPKGDPDVLYAYPWQKECFEEIAYVDRSILSSSTGSGKTATMEFVAAHHLLNDTKIKIIMAPPQRVIAKGFNKVRKLILPTGEEFEWKISNATNLIDGDSNIDDRTKLEKAESWLRKRPKPDKFSSRICLMSHSVLVSLHKKLKSENKLGLFNDVFLFIDEAHHVKNAQVATEDENEEWVDSNELGSVVKTFCANKKSKLSLVTATFNRGDRLGIIPENLKNEFVRFNLPFDEFLMKTPGIDLESLEFRFIIYKENPAEAILELVKEKLCKNIIYLPYRNSRAASECKNSEVEDIKNELEDKRVPRKKDKYGNEIFKIKGYNKQCVIVNLVEEKGRKEKLKYIEEVSESNSGPDFIIVLGMFKEGADYPPANRGIIIGARKSNTENLQITGRVLRPFKGKKHVSICYLLPMSFGSQNSEEFKKSLNDYIKAIIGSLMMYDVLFPNILQPKAEGRERGHREAQPNPFLELVEDEQKRRDILTRIAEELPHSVNDDGSVDRDKFDRIVKSTFKDFGHNEDEVESMPDYMYRYFSRLTMLVEGLNVSEIDFDLIEEGDPVGWMKHFTSGIINGDIFNKLRVLFEQKNGEQAAIDMLNEIMSTYTYDNLPNKRSKNAKEKSHGIWIQRQRMIRSGSISNCILYPVLDEIIKGTEWENIFNQIDYVEENREKTLKYIRKYKGKKSPSVSSDNEEEKRDAHWRCRQVSNKKYNKNWDKELDIIAAKNGMPDLFKPKNCEQQNVDILYEYMEMFDPNEKPSQLKSKKEKRMLNWLYQRIGAKSGTNNARHYPILDKIAEKNGYRNLFDAKDIESQNNDKIREICKKFPNKFPSQNSTDSLERSYAFLISDLRKAKNGNNIRRKNSWHPSYEETAKKYGCPYLFSPKTTLEKHLDSVNELLKNNNGILPSPDWLQKNGFNSLDQYMRKYPDEFEHIKQECKKGKTKNEWISFAEKRAKANGGYLDNPKQLIQEGLEGLYYCMRNNTNDFKHIPQKKKGGRSVDEWHDIAKKLHDKHGFIPGFTELKKLGYSALYQCMKKYPEKFEEFTN